MERRGGRASINERKKGRNGRIEIIKTRIQPIKLLTARPLRKRPFTIFTS
jgi:hypothetical protein